MATAAGPPGAAPHQLWVVLVSRHPNVEHMLETLKPNPRLDGIALDVAVAIHQSAVHMADLLNDGPELVAGLRKLREAKDCFVIQGLMDTGKLGVP
jgi:hypothetical protein